MECDALAVMNDIHLFCSSINSSTTIRGVFQVIVCYFDREFPFAWRHDLWQLLLSVGIEATIIVKCSGIGRLMMKLSQRK